MAKKSSLVIMLTLVGLTAFAKDKPKDYQVGTLLSASAKADGTITNTLHGDGTTVAGGVYRTV